MVGHSFEVRCAGRLSVRCCDGIVVIVSMALCRARFGRSIRLQSSQSNKGDGSPQHGKELKPLCLEAKPSMKPFYRKHSRSISPLE
jgi:hypothetical protein